MTAFYIKDVLIQSVYNPKVSKTTLTLSTNLKYNFSYYIVLK